MKNISDLSVSRKAARSQRTQRICLAYVAALRPCEKSFQQEFKPNH